jgi:diguanylate cyclase (GGDEF)-like protein
VCALFWIVLVQASAGVAIWGSLWTVATIISGAIAIAAMGCWAAEAQTGLSPTATTAQPRPESVGESQGDEGDTVARCLCAAVERFDNWLEAHRNESNPWPKFDEFIRSVMFDCSKASHVRPYRLLGEGDELAPLREPDSFTDMERVPARRGILGHVVTTGRSYLAAMPTHGQLVEELAEQAAGSPVWCFAVRQGTRRLGAVVVGHLDIPPERNGSLLRATELLIGQFWCTLHETVVCRSAVEDDPVSGLRTRPVFLPSAEQALHESYRNGEPVAVVAIALEGLRELNDTGRWEVADELVREVAGWLRRKVRMDDRLGRFDGSRFLLLLRRVDSELAALIVTQMMSRIVDLCRDEARWHASVDVRCGVVGSGTGQPDLRTLASRALAQCRRARLEGVLIATDLEPEVVAGGATQ